jgi:hypothetical protein
MKEFLSKIFKYYDPFTLIHHKNYDVSKIEKHISSYTEKEWLLDTSRQSMFGSHQETNSYFITDHRANWNLRENYEPIFRCQDPVLWELVKPIIEDLEHIHNGKVGKSLLIKLPAHASIEDHYDSGQLLGVSRRNHVVITTNPDVSFIVDTDTVHMKQGECWEINNDKRHEVINAGDTDRVHLLVDIIPQWAIDMYELQRPE